MEPKKTPTKSAPKEASSPQGTGAAATASSSQTSPTSQSQSMQRHDLQGIGSWAGSTVRLPTTETDKNDEVAHCE
ncbi:hypothetical protein N7451_009886 [Penicillium sp. IBT 35674x]|nr:hypothetical protein N7451_009886 [Penicillium sp. IBT 35674x]